MAAFGFIRWFALAALPVAAFAATPSARIQKTIDRDWTFQYFPQPEPDLGPAAPDYRDDTWPAVGLPHTWSTYETTGAVHPFIQAANEQVDSYWWYGWGWYRKRIILGEQYAGRLVSLEFDGVQKYSRVYVNGKCAGEHKGGYTSFSVDITPFVKFGQKNVIAVLVSNRRDDPNRIPPMTAGNFDVYGGIYRDVRLVIKDRLHFPFQGSADYEGGAFITTPQVSAEAGTIRIQSWIRNDYPETRNSMLITQIVDAEGKPIAELSSRQVIPSGQTQEVEQTATIQHPHLWSPDSPYFYTVHSEILQNGQLADAIDNPLGFRWFVWNKAEHRLYLNGNAIVLNGTNRHQEYPWLGDAIPNWMHQKDLEDIRFNLGHNFQRTVHYPNDPYVYDLSDRLGIITMEEVPNIKDIVFNRAVQEQNVREMIRRDRNHPSIFFWSMGNETNQPANSKWAWEEDKTRIINLRRGTNGGDYVQTTEDDLALESLLRCTVRGWHDGDRQFPDGGHPASGQVTGTEEWQHDVNAAEIARRQGKNLVVFLYADHGADRKYLYNPLLFVNPKGWVDAYRNPKYMHFLWEANYGPKPVLFIEPHLWRSKYLGQKKDITVDSNCDSVTLRVNGREIGRLQPTGANAHSVVFHDVPIERGTLSADGTWHGRPVHQAVHMPGEPECIVVTASSKSIPAGRNGIATVRAEIVDRDGNWVMGANPPLTWKVEGPAKLVGPPVYITDALKNGALEGEMYIDTPISNVVRSTARPGRIIVTVEAPGLKPGCVVIRAVLPPDREIAGIVEPPLSDEDRKPVVRDASFKAIVVHSAKGRIAELALDRDFPRTDAGGYAQALVIFIQQQNPGVDTSTPEFKALVSDLASDLVRTHGHLIADDYNFLVRQFNKKRTK